MTKAKKPKRPLSKSTTALLDQLKRRRGVRDLAKRFLIVCEDEKSAPNYFRALKKEFNLTAASVEVVGSGGNSQPIQIVKRAIEVQKAAAKAESTEPFEQVWCVLDGDYGNEINNARASAEENKIRLAISTKCFEYWVLLHFEQSAVPSVNCRAIVSSLRKKHVPDYEKGSCDFQKIVQYVHDASKRAESLRKPGIARNELPENQNPCSEVYLLVNAILDSCP